MRYGQTAGHLDMERGGTAVGEESWS